MKKPLLIIIITLLSISGYSQAPFLKGYYIDNSGQKFNGEIRILDAGAFEYKLTPSEPYRRATVQTVKEFGFDNSSKYTRHTVAIDRSNERLNDMSTDIEPQFKQEELFLNVLVEGKSTLYEYADGNLLRFFYSRGDGVIEQLIFKSYRTDDNKIAKNTSFRQQLWDNLKCQAIELSSIKELAYARPDLVDFFVKYNNCYGQAIVNAQAKVKMDLFNLTLRPRLVSSALKIAKSPTYTFINTNFGSKTGFSLGAEAEVLSPFDKNNWSLILEPTFQSFKAEKSVDENAVTGGKLISKAKYKTTELNAGIRHYFVLNDQSKFFINGTYVIDISSKSSMEFTRADGSVITAVEATAQSGSNFTAGAGFKKGNFSLEGRYHTTRDVLDKDSDWKSEYNAVSIILGYSLF